MNKKQKALILQAYFDKAISKMELNTLLKHGIVFPPIPWVFDDMEQERQETQRRQLICRVFNLKDTVFKWV